MARLISIGHELQSITNLMEWSDTANTPAIDTTTIHGGGALASMRSNKGAVAGATSRHIFATANQTKPFFIRIYYFFTSLSGTTGAVLQVQNAAANTQMRVEFDGTTKKWQYTNAEDSITTVGTTAISTGQWYRVELKVDTTTLAATTWELKVNGSIECSGTENYLTGIARIRAGSGNNPSNMDFYWDDVSINDNSGSFQNTYPGDAFIIHLKPNAAGDNASWAIGTGSTFAEVDEITPDDATTTIASQTNNQISDFNIDNTPAGMNSYDIINVVSVGVRFASDSGAGATFVTRVKASSGGTVEESANITPSSATYFTNQVADPRTYALVLYDLPGASTTAWTKADLDVAQVGVRMTGIGAFATKVSTLWLLVDYTTGTAPVAGTNVDYRSLLGVGI